MQGTMQLNGLKISLHMTNLTGLIIHPQHSCANLLITISSVDLKKELNKVKVHMFKEFTKNGKKPIYEADLFRQFCQQAGAHTLFDSILSSVTDARHSDDRVKLNEKRVVGIIYSLVYCISQRCNVMQVDQALYLQTSHVNQEAIMTEHQLGNTCSKRYMNNIRKSLSQNHQNSLEKFFTDAIQNEWLVVLIIDDYTTVHTIRRPTETKLSQANSMWTIVAKAFKEIAAVPRPNDIRLLHDPEGVNVDLLLSTITSPVQMSLLANSYAATLPNWITNKFFNPELQLERLRDHQYSESNSVRDMRKMDDVYLINFIELVLKGKDPCEVAYDAAMSTHLKAYAKKFVVPQPGDWPCQFYCRQVIYQHTYTSSTKESTPKAKTVLSEMPEHDYCFKVPHHSTSNEQSKSPLSSIAPMMGPLHISLNSKEHVFLTFWPFF